MIFPITYSGNFIPQKMPVRNLITKEIHRGSKGGRTGCGYNTNIHPEHWVNVSGKITCTKNGCNKK